MAAPVVVQVLVGVLAPSGGDHAGAADKTIDQKRQFVGVGAKGFQRKVSAGTHFKMVVGRDVHREQLGLAGFVLGALERVIHQRQGLFDRRKHLVALRLVVFDEVAPQPELVSRLGKGFGAQTEFRFDDGADNKAAVFDRAAQNAPQIADVFGRSVKHLDDALGHVKIDHLGVFDVTHALVVANGQRQEGHQHEAPVGDVAVKQRQRVGNAHVLGGLIDVVDQRVHISGEVVGGAHLHVGAGRGLGSKVGRGFQIIQPVFGGHFVGAQNVLAPCNEGGFLEA